MILYIKIPSKNKEQIKSSFCFSVNPIKHEISVSQNDNIDLNDKQ